MTYLTSSLQQPSDRACPTTHGTYMYMDGMQHPLIMPARGFNNQSAKAESTWQTAEHGQSHLYRS